ncbi:MAG: ATP-dependent RecD-like DNA helicase [Candidatus Poribacteria bacterium]|nr:ATP-dependent RecD-like DNA helicase [Candidatus Poribacteria bacterium]
METLTGILERIVFENPETGYTIGRLTSRDYPTELITVVGNFASANAGESLALKGWWVNNPQYGQQFKIETYETVLPATIVGLRKYLGSGLIKGIGPVMAARIVNHFGMDTMDVIEKTPQKLNAVPGIGRKRVDMIKKAWEAQREIKNVMLFLQSNNVSTTYSVKIYKTYESESISIVRENPYRLADDIYGIGFKTADTIAQNLGIDKESPHRVTAGIKYVLGQKADDGHVFLYRGQLIGACQEILELPLNAIEAGMTELIGKEEIVAEDVDGEVAVYLVPFYYAEVGVTNAFSRLLKTETPAAQLQFVAGSIDLLEKQMGIHFAANQRAAIRTALESRVMILTGGPGTGKTTTTIGMIRLFEALEKRVMLAAPTGRAAKRLSETTGREAKTIHRLLEFSPQDNGFKRNWDNPLEADVVIIDEMSMVDLVLMNSLMKAVPRHATLIMVGDVDQLPSVGAGNVLKDLIASEQITVVKLTEIFRQAQQSLIVTNAHRINRGDFPQITGTPDRNFFFIEEEEPEQVADLICDLVHKRLPKHYGYHPMDDIQVLCPMRRGTVGSENFNKQLQAVLNPDSTGTIRGGRNFRVGDKVMQVRNNYDYEVFNGDIGRITDVDAIEKQVTIQFPEKVVAYDMADMNELVLAYGITVHKAQGSEYPAVVVPLMTQHYLMLQRNLLYTAITRAKELVVLVGTKKALGIAIRSNKVVERNSYLAERVQAAMRQKVGRPESRREEGGWLFTEPEPPSQR